MQSFLQWIFDNWDICESEELMNRLISNWNRYAIVIVAVVFLTEGLPAQDGASSQSENQIAAVQNSGGSSRAIGHPTFVSPHVEPIAVHGNFVFVANTPSDTLDVIDVDTKLVVKRIHVGIDPVSVVVRPDGKEIWVANHISDSVSVIDNDPNQSTYLEVIATVQEFDEETKATRFDEPVGIAFANNQKAYVALSSENEIAVVDVADRSIARRLHITAQDPRAMVVRGDRLYVIPFESNNKTQLSGGTGAIDDDLVTFNAWEHAIANNNVLSLGAVVDIIKHPRVPDRDLYVFDTATDELVEVVDTLGTLLYGLTVDSKGQVFVAQTDARNEVNGRAGTKDHGLAEMENRAFLNQITKVSFEGDEGQETEFFDLEPLPPTHPAEGMALATPFAIEISDDDKTLFVSAAGSDKLFAVNAEDGQVLGRVAVGAVPRGIALVSDAEGRARHAWVLNAVANTVSLVDVQDVQAPEVKATVELEDPTHPTVKRGRIAFNTASASSTGTFSCASCHPDGHTDQLLWVLKTPVVTGGDQIMPRSTMPIRGLRDTAPYHWDGIPGDPYGGNNSANVHGSDEPNSRIDDPASTTRHLIDGGLASTMLLEGDDALNDEGKAGRLTASERDDMAVFLLSVPYPPAQRRAFDNVLSEDAQDGFRLFHIEGDYQGGATSNVCGDCHRMPFWVSTNTPGTGMDAPTWRGAYDRFLILPQGRLNIIDFDFYRDLAERGIPERNMWQFSWAGRRRFDPVWDMVLEGSTGHSGSLGRQLTLNPKTADGELAKNLLDALELSAAEGAVVLEAEGVVIEDEEVQQVALQFKGDSQGGAYISKASDEEKMHRSELLDLAANGKFVGTFTARHGAKDDVENPQPGIWTVGPIERQRGRQEFPFVYPENREMKVSGRYIDPEAKVFVNGRQVSGGVRLEDNEVVFIELETLPNEGMHFLQLQNPDGMFSNDFIFHVTKDEASVRKRDRELRRTRVAPQARLARSVARGDLEEIERLLENGAAVNARQPGEGSTALSTAALHGNVDAVKMLIENGARPNWTNQDGNTPLHVAAFLCHPEVLEILLENGGSSTVENERGETPIDVVSGEWNEGLGQFYLGIGRSIGQDIDLDYIRVQRPKIAKMLEEYKD
ncbi:MAG: hypothetical protein CMJ77_14810 [Planctomycetaceae bacterium]|nr:hypothetical protein [Planctomycetaceae bacterium]